MTATTAYDRALESSKPTPQWEVDLAFALGYELESFDGIYKLTPDPFIVGADYVLAEEVVTGDDGRTALFDDNGDRVTRLVSHPIPEGWSVVPAFRIVPPAGGGARMTDTPRRKFLSREEERALVVRALEVLQKAVAPANDRRWEHYPDEDRYVVVVPSLLGDELVAEGVKPEYADVITLAVPAARGLIAVLQDVKLIMNAYPTPEAVRGEIARGVRLAKLILGEQ